MGSRERTPRRVTFVGSEDSENLENPENTDLKKVGSLDSLPEGW